MSKQVRDLILWLRKERISCSSLTIGNVTLEGMFDGKLAEQMPHAKPEAPQTMWERYGAALFEKPATVVDEIPDEAKTDD